MDEGKIPTLKELIEKQEKVVRVLKGELEHAESILIALKLRDEELDSDSD